MPRASTGVWFGFERARVPAGTLLTCVVCEAPFRADVGWVGARCGNEMLGVLGPCCLAPDAVDRFRLECGRLERGERAH